MSNTEVSLGHSNQVFRQAGRLNLYCGYASIFKPFQCIENLNKKNKQTVLDLLLKEAKIQGRILSLISYRNLAFNL